jgi:hypothetical protein
VNMVSAISPRGELRFLVQEGKMNAGKFIDFLKALLDSEAYAKPCEIVPSTVRRRRSQSFMIILSGSFA